MGCTESIEPDSFNLLEDYEARKSTHHEAIMKGSFVKVSVKRMSFVDHNIHSTASSRITFSSQKSISSRDIANSNNSNGKPKKLLTLATNGDTKSLPVPDDLTTKIKPRKNALRASRIEVLGLEILPPVTSAPLHSIVEEEDNSPAELFPIYALAQQPFRKFSEAVPLTSSRANSSLKESRERGTSLGRSRSMFRRMDSTASASSLTLAQVSLHSAHSEHWSGSISKHSSRALASLDSRSVSLSTNRGDYIYYSPSHSPQRPPRAVSPVKLAEVDNSILPFLKEGLTLSAILRFIDSNGGAASFTQLTTAQVNEKFVLRITSSSSLSYCQHLRLNPDTTDVGPAQVFISHAWQYLFLDVVEALKSHFKGAEETYLWFDLFSNNQHSSSSFDWWSETFKSAIAHIGHTVLILAPWNDPVPLRRAWCLWELYCTVEAGSVFEVAMTQAEQRSFVECILSDFDAVNRMIATIDAENSQCHFPDDRERIFEAVRSTVGFEYINSVIFERLRQWVISTVLEAIENAGEHADVLGLKSVLGELYMGQGRYAEAEPYLIECFEIRKVTLGPSDPQTFTAAQNLASVFEELDKEEEALKMYTFCLDAISLLPTAGFEDASASYYRLYAYLAEKGKLAVNAEGFLLQSVTASVQKYGEHHLETLVARRNLSTVYMNEGKYMEAESLLLLCLDSSKILLGLDHPDTLSCQDSLGDVYISMKRYEEAEKLLKVVYDKRKVKLGPSHPATLSTQDSLTSVYATLKKNDLARILFQEGLAARILKFGEYHQDTLLYSFNVANFYLSIGDSIKAEDIYTNCLHGSQLRLGRTHFLTMSCQNSLASHYSTVGDFVAAERLYAQCLDASKEVVGLEKPSTIACLEKLCTAMRAQQKVSEAQQLITAYIQELERMTGDTNEFVQSFKLKYFPT